ncbi:hypothetical protein SAMN05518672_10464 [Chitinophaga sp. CF118]|uniref:hypothetical protein n=1 Tax=Chitinophaga sp. CF118 TaxID=1884367 RepID=UPI0008EC67C2|nr:hypothetical protein [Chitinophaga sp. CF118]SFD99087.1 hypothetical protein SAMN05518672_10464 [Chitinophaga sp. CF118]
MYYRIQPRCGIENNTVLSVNNNDLTGNLIINTFKEGDDSQLWQPIVYDLKGNYIGIVLLNKKTGLVAIAPENFAPVRQCKVSEMADQRVTWNLAGTAIQLRNNTDMNLNVKGNGPYPPGTEVYVWDWSKGDPNETWNLLAADF